MATGFNRGDLINSHVCESSGFQPGGRDPHKKFQNECGRETISGVENKRKKSALQIMFNFQMSLVSLVKYWIV